MNECLYCGKPVNNKYCGVSCQNKHQGSEKSNNRFGVITKYEVNCYSCGKSIFVLEREKLFPTKGKYYCDRSCANKRNHSIKTKELISETLTKHSDIIKKCDYCENDFIVPYKKRNQKCCSKTCSSKLVNERTRINKQSKTHFKLKIETVSDKITYIYSLEYPLGNIRYVGKSDNPENRLKKHIYEAKTRNKNHKDHWINSIDDKPILKIIEQVSYSNWQEREIFWINFYKNNGFNLVNGTIGGEGSDGFKNKTHTIETKLRISKTNKNHIVSEKTKELLKGENNGRCRFSDLEIINIYRLKYKDKLNNVQIGKIYNISHGYVSQILNGKKRKSIYIDYVEDRLFLS